MAIGGCESNSITDNTNKHTRIRKSTMYVCDSGARIHVREKRDSHWRFCPNSHKIRQMKPRLLNTRRQDFSRSLPFRSPNIMPLLALLPSHLPARQIIVGSSGNGVWFRACHSTPTCLCFCLRRVELQPPPRTPKC